MRGFLELPSSSSVQGLFIMGLYITLTSFLLSRIFIELGTDEALYMDKKKKSVPDNTLSYRNESA